MKQQIDIRQLGLDHFDESMNLSQFAFQTKKSDDELNQMKEEFQAVPAVRYGAYDGEQLAAQATILELHTYIGGQRFAMGGVAGVATWPEYRRQGLVAALLSHSLKEMKDKGQTISFLHPFSFSFYRKFGWETYTDNKKYTIQSELLPKRAPYTGHIKRIYDDLSVLNPIYKAYATQYNGALERTEVWWKYRISRRKQGQVAVYTNLSGEAQGYLIYEVKNKQLTIHELIYINEEARVALWSFVSQHDSMIDAVTITVPSDDLLSYTLPNPRIKQEIAPYFMARIVDVEAFVSLYRFSEASEDDHLYIQITDEHAPWNAGYYVLQILASGQATLKRQDEHNCLESSIKMDICSLTAILLGYRRPIELERLAHIKGEVNNIKRLHVRIPERTTYLPDFF